MKFKSLTLSLLGLLFWVNGVSAQDNVYQWANKVGINGQDRFLATSLDDNGNTYSVGSFTNAIQINGTTYTSNGNSDLMIIKFNSLGQVVWALSLGGNGEDGATSVAYDNGFLYVGGYFSSSVNFDPANSLNVLTSEGGKDAFVLKIDTLGDFVWVKQWSGVDEQQVKDVVVNSAHEILVVGNFEGVSKLDPNAAITTNSQGAKDFFVTKLDAAGSTIWTRNWGGIDDDEVKGVAVSSADEILLTGYFKDEVQFDTTAGATPLQSAGLEDLFVLKLTNSGHFDWCITLPNADRSIGNDLAIENAEIALVGSFSGTISLSVNGVHQNIVSNGFQDMFIAKLDANNGDFMWISTAGSNSYDEALAVQMDALGDVYAAGYFASTIQFDANHSLSSSGFFDAFAVKFTNNGSCEWAKRFSGTNNEQANDILVTPTFEVYVVGEFAQTVDFNPSIANNSLTTDGSTDAFIVKLQKCSATNGVHTVIACGSYTWFDGVTYTQNNNVATYVMEGGNSIGCDSVLTLNLTLKQNTTGVHTVTACQKYTWLNGVTYTENNTTATHKLEGAAANGCDSILTLNLTIKPLDPTITYSVSTGELRANQENATYQWINCDNNTAITGATEATYSVTQSGNYALAVTYNGCTDTSDCIEFLDVSIQENETDFVIYPNPSEGIFTVQNIVNGKEQVSLSVFTTDGKFILFQKMEASQNTIDLSSMPSGVYILKIQSADSILTQKLIKK